MDYLSFSIQIQFIIYKGRQYLNLIILNVLKFAQSIKAYNFFEAFIYITYYQHSQVNSPMTEEPNNQIREKVSLSDNLPKIAADVQIQQLKKIYYASQTTKQKYFPLQKQVKYQNNFGLFDRNDDKLLDFQQLKQFLISIGQMINQADLKDFYKCLSQTQQKQDGHIQEGITLDNIYLIVLKKLREQDIQQQLSEAFRIVDTKNNGFLQSEDFKQLLMTMGYKWSQDQTDQFIKQFQPKSQKKIYWAEVVKKVLKR